MKKLLLFLFLILYSLFFIPKPGLALTPQPSPTASEDAATPAPPIASPTPDMINQLKDRIASRVAQLKLVEKRGFIGTVTAVTNTQITLTDLQNNTRFIDVDELTKFSTPAKTTTDTFGISDITKGTTLSALGLYNKESKRLLARFITVVNLPQFISGVITLVDKENYTITVATDNQKQFTIDIESTTKTYSYIRETGLVRAGFSKLLANERVFAAGALDIKKANHLIGLRVIRFPQVPVNPDISVPSSQATPPASPTPSATIEKQQ